MDKIAPTLLKQWLEAEGRKIKWLAAQVPADRATVSIWVNGHQVPRLEYRQRLQEVTGLPVADERAWL